MGSTTLKWCKPSSLRRRPAALFMCGPIHSTALPFSKPLSCHLRTGLVLGSWPTIASAPDEAAAAGPQAAGKPRGRCASGARDVHPIRLSRDVRVGSGLRGLHDAKSILLEGPSGPELVAGSLNFTYHQLTGQLRAWCQVQSACGQQCRGNLAHGLRGRMG